MDAQVNHLKARMNHPVFVNPRAMEALQAFSALGQDSTIPDGFLELVYLRASQINGCAACVDGHPRLAKKYGESDERLFAVAAWREAPYFSAAERAALALTEAMTRLADREDPVPDAIWNEVTKHYDEKELSALLFAIASINVWNRLNVATRQPAGQWKP